jgi:hypothetical protein
MNNTSKNRKLVGPTSKVTGVSFANEAKLLLARCLILKTILTYLIYTRLLEAQAFQVASHICCVLQMSS